MSSGETEETQTIALFPLRAVLFPNGRLPLQIFEQRYIDLISQSLRNDKGFGICLLSEGEEVVQPGKSQQVHRVGTYARIVDWDELPSGLLGVTVEGRQKFMVEECWAAENQLLMARVRFCPIDVVGIDPIPVESAHEDLVTLLQQLSSHPVIEKLNMSLDFENVRELAWRLSELIPLSLEAKQELLEVTDPMQRIDRIEALLAEIIDQR
ncbi:MAG: LON peptidase substrate-binding domain-containing protein [Pseudohongiellaceae bacterium]|nr:LON peptidase substrate-binding domain-containing protein [Pseudohongiellaceae bacterium]